LPARLVAGRKGRKYTARRSTCACVARSSQPARGCRVPVSRKTPVKKRVDAWWPVAGWTLFILLLTSVPLPTMVGLSGSNLDKLVHFGLYLGLGLTLGRAALISGYRGVAMLLGLLLAGIAFAAVDELLQNWVPRRAPQMADWLADVAGLVTGYVLYVARRRHRWKTEAQRTRQA
jgi:VanZ family protein